MTYTVKEFAQLSGVSVRTLHWYDQVDLLKPAYTKENGYRYYEEAQLSRLQKILFFRALGVKLVDIRPILSSNTFDQRKDLYTCRGFLMEKINKMLTLVEKIDHSIEDMKGEVSISYKALLNDLNRPKTPPYVVHYTNIINEKSRSQRKMGTTQWGAGDWKRLEEQGRTIYKNLCNCIEQKRTAQDDEVQKLIHAHYQLVGRLCEVTNEIYLSLGDLYSENPD